MKSKIYCNAKFNCLLFTPHKSMNQIVSNQGYLLGLKPNEMLVTLSILDRVQIKLKVNKKLMLSYIVFIFDVLGSTNG